MHLDPVRFRRTRRRDDRPWRLVGITLSGSRRSSHRALLAMAAVCAIAMPTASTALAQSQTAPDTSPPAITPHLTGQQGFREWYVGDVEVTWSLTDPESAITGQQGCQPAKVIADTAWTELTCRATSQGGTSTQKAGVKRDATPPSVQVGIFDRPFSGNWYNHDVVVQSVCADAVSGVDFCPPPQVLSQEGQAVASTPKKAWDKAGNSTLSNVVTVGIDKTAPTVVSAVTDGPTSGKWFNHGVTVRFTCADRLSGVHDCPPAQLLTQEGEAVTSTAAWATDNAGNRTQSNVVSVAIDETPPTVTATGVTNGATYYYPTVAIPKPGCVATDNGGSGVIIQPTLTLDSTDDRTGAPISIQQVDMFGGTLTATCSGAKDAAGNVSRDVSVTYALAMLFPNYPPSPPPGPAQGGGGGTY